jgi:hypothetical protein
MHDDVVDYECVNTRLVRNGSLKCYGIIRVRLPFADKLKPGAQEHFGSCGGARSRLGVFSDELPLGLRLPPKASLDAGGK